MTLRSLFVLTTAWCMTHTTHPSYGAPADEFPLTEDSKVHDGVPNGELIKDTHVAKVGSVFPGTEREYQIYIPAGLDKTKPAPFMVFQDGVIYQAPTVFDNLIARKEIPALIGIFIKPGVVPAANDNALPRYNRSYEYDSVTDTYSRFLIDEFLPPIKAKHGLNLSTDPNARAIAGNSSGGICAFMVAWHRPDQFRRVFTGVGTYVGIHGADQLPVLVRKYEPKPLRVWLQSGENDNNLYCGDWWMANQMMERSLTWNGYEVNHTWGNGGHNAKHATQIFPEVLRWLWKGYPDEPVRANPRGDAKWRGYEVIGDGEWKEVTRLWDFVGKLPDFRKDRIALWEHMTASADGTVFVSEPTNGMIVRVAPDGTAAPFGPRMLGATGLSIQPDGSLCVGVEESTGDRDAKPPKTSKNSLVMLDKTGAIVRTMECDGRLTSVATTHTGEWFVAGEPRWGDFSSIILGGPGILHVSKEGKISSNNLSDGRSHGATHLALSPDQTQIYASLPGSNEVQLWSLSEGKEPLINNQSFVRWEAEISPQRYERQRWGGVCVDTNGWLYIATQSGIQVCDQCGRVNFIIPTPQIPSDVCFAGEHLDELWFVCEDRIYKRKTKAHGYISGQMAPIKPPAPKL